MGRSSPCRGGPGVVCWFALQGPVPWDGSGNGREALARSIKWMAQATGGTLAAQTGALRRAPECRRRR